jgi:outer membrane protein assembly factor BamB
LTDIHLREGAMAPTRDLRNAIEQINKTDSIDFILVTGDIADEGDKASLRNAKEELDKLVRPYYIVMGNHDTKWSESGCTDFKNIFGYERFELNYKGYLFLGFNSGPIIRMALGHVAPEDLDWLKQKLDKNGVTGKPVFLVTHYPMLPDDVDNCFDVTDVVRNYPVKAFIGGHYHSNRLFNYDGIPGIINRSTLKGNAKAGGYNEFDITADSMIVYEHKIGMQRIRWAAISLRNKVYSKEPGSKALRPDYSVNAKYADVKEEWKKESRVGIYGSPAVYKNMVYTADNIGRIICYNLKTGERLWTFNCKSRVLGTPAAAKGVVVTGSTNNKIYGIDARSGELLWAITTEAPVLGAVKIVDGIAYIGASDHCMRAINIKDGTVIWKYNGVKGYIETMPLITSDKVIFGAWDNTLYALNRTDGTEVWKWNDCHPGMHYSPAAVWPVSAQGKVFIADPQRALSAIDLKTGKTIWRTLRSQVRETVGISADNERIYSKTMNDSIVCYSAISNVPEELWASNVGFGYEHAPSMQEEKDGIVFGSTKSGLIFALDGKTGKVFWKYKVGNTLINTVVPVSKTEVLFTNEDGTVGKLRINKKVYSNKK